MTNAFTDPVTLTAIDVLDPEGASRLHLTVADFGGQLVLAGEWAIANRASQCLSA